MASGGSPVIVRSGNDLLYGALYAAAWRTGIWLPEQDWALQKDPEVWEKVRRDPVVEHAISQRLHSIASRSWRITAGGEDPASQRLAEITEEVIEGIENFTTAQYQLAVAIMTARSYGYIEGHREMRDFGDGMVNLWVPLRIQPIDRRRVRFNSFNQFDTMTGELKQPKVVPEIAALQVGVWKEITPAAWKNMIKVVYDDEEGRLGYGRGILAAIYFYHYAKGVTLREGLQGIERWAQGLKIAKIDLDRPGSTSKTNNDIKNEWITELNKSMGQHTLAIGKNDDLDVVWPSGAGSSMIKDMLEYLDRGVTQLILGSVLPTGGGANVGSNARATVEEDSSERLIVYDRRILDEAITRDLIGQFLRLNWAQFTQMGLGGAKKPKLSSVNEKRQDPETNARVAASLLGIPGMSLRADEVYEKTGWTKPKPGEEVLEGTESGGGGGGFGGGFGGGGFPPGPAEPDEPGDAAPAPPELAAKTFQGHKRLSGRISDEELIRKVIKMVREENSRPFLGCSFTAAEFEEEKHPRADDGKFAPTEGGGGKGKDLFVPSKTRGHKKVNEQVENAISLLKELGVDLPDTIQVAPLKSKAAAWFDTNDREAGNRVTINPKSSWWKDPVAAAKRNSGHLSSDNPMHPVFHEVGHSNHVKNGANKEQLRNRNFFGEQKEMIEKEVSKYATTNGMEFVAEVFAGKVNGSEYNEEIERLYKFLGGTEV